MTYIESKAFSINYDLKQPGRDYTGLFDAIKQSSKWWHYLDSTWIVQTTEGANEVYQRLRAHIDDNDFLLVIEVRDNSQGWLPKDAWDWIHANVPPG